MDIKSHLNSSKLNLRKFFKRRISFSIILHFLLFSGLFGQNILINEFMALNETSLTDEDGEYVDWIELYNATDNPINLLNWSITDDINIPTRWIFPNVSIQAGEYLVVYASGKDRYIPGSNLHTNFNINSTGEYLGLYDHLQTLVCEFSPTFPVQKEDYSYGFIDGGYSFFNIPSPGTENLAVSVAIPAPSFSVKRGFFESSFELNLSTNVSNGKIIYTTNGSAPTYESGIEYTGPIQITTTTIVRAITFMSNLHYSDSETHSYFFLNDVLQQPNQIEGYPSFLGPYANSSGKAIADYEMDPELMANSDFASKALTSLKFLPTISVVTDINNLFLNSKDPDLGGIYIYTGSNGAGDGWERKASVEIIEPNGIESIQIGCGLRLSGGASRDPEKSPKHSFRLAFRSEYGSGKLNYSLFDSTAVTEHNSIVLRAGFNNSWTHWSDVQRKQSQYIHDIWSKDVQRAMGHPSVESSFAHLYLNGIYWGIYAPTERIENDFAVSYMGGEEEEYDVIKDMDMIDGDVTAWNNMMAQAVAGLTSNEAYYRIQGKNSKGVPDPNIEAMIDVVNLADYILINFYGGNSDWDGHNWGAMRNRIFPEKGYKFLCWDAERTLETVTRNEISTNNSNRPSGLFKLLTKNEEFKRLFSDRVQLHCFNNGVLTPEKASNIWLNRSVQIDKALYAESARWGDYRRDVHPYRSGPYDLYTVEDHWLPQQDFMLNIYFNDRTNEFIKQLQAANLFPTVFAPEIKINGSHTEERIINTGDFLSFSTLQGLCYYTTNGTDPVLWDGDLAIVSPDAHVYYNTVELDQSVHIKTRAFSNGIWSAMAEQYFILRENYFDIKITELYYHPQVEIEGNEDDLEFIELKNIGLSTLDLGGVKFVGGIEYEFPNNTSLGSKEFIVLASDKRQFLYNNGFFSGAEYKGNLNNAGEQIILLSPFNDTIQKIFFSDEYPWPTEADGDGYSLVPVTFNPEGDPNDAFNWRNSLEMGGSPGRDDAIIIASIQMQSVNSFISMEQNYPNPFSELTYIQFSIPESDYVDISIYKLTGEKVYTLLNEQTSAGSHLLEWNGRNYSGQKLETGIYYYRIMVNSDDRNSVQTKKMIIMR